MQSGIGSIPSDRHPMYFVNKQSLTLLCAVNNFNKMNINALKIAAVFLISHICLELNAQNFQENCPGAVQIKKGENKGL